MSVAYGLYNRETKEYLWLGKRRGWTDEGSTGFDVSAEKIVAFMSRKWTGEKTVFEIYPDTGDMPDDLDGGWSEVD